jgi:hypothetical protein
MNHHHELTRHEGAGLADRYTVDGKRCSEERFDHLETLANIGGRLSCLLTTSRELIGGTRWAHHKIVQF